MLDTFAVRHKSLIETMSIRCDFVRQAAEAVLQFGGKTVKLVLRWQVSKPPVHAKAHLKVRDEVFRQQYGRANIDLRRPLAIGFDFKITRAQRGNSLFQHVLIKLEADFLDVA
jgi:hypothetical protein